MVQFGLRNENSDAVGIANAKPRIKSTVMSSQVSGLTSEATAGGPHVQIVKYGLEADSVSALLSKKCFFFECFGRQMVHDDVFLLTIGGVYFLDTIVVKV